MARAAPLPTAKRQSCRFRRPARPCSCRRPRRLRRRSRSPSSRCLRRAGSGRSPSASMAVPASFAAAATTSATGVLLSMTNSWREQRIFLAELGQAALDHLLDDVLRLAALLRLFHRDRALALDQRRIELVARRAPAGGPRRRASRSACRARSASRPAPRSRARRARRSCRGPARPGCGRRARPRPRSTSSTAARRSDWFSPILAMLSVSFSCDGAAAGIVRQRRAPRRRVPCSSASSATLRTKSWNMLVLGDEIGFRIDLDERAALALDGDADEALGGGAAGLLGGGGQALGAQPVDRGFHLAVGSRRAPSCSPSCRRRCARAVPSRSRP